MGTKVVVILLVVIVVVFIVLVVWGSSTNARPKTTLSEMLTTLTLSHTPPCLLSTTFSLPSVPSLLLRRRLLISVAQILRRHLGSQSRQTKITNFAQPNSA